MIRIQICKKLLIIKRYIYGNNNWIASNVIILSKCKIENNNVVGANVIVNKEYDSDNILKIDNVSIVTKKIKYKE